MELLSSTSAPKKEESISSTEIREPQHQHPPFLESPLKEGMTTTEIKLQPSNSSTFLSSPDEEVGPKESRHHRHFNYEETTQSAQTTKLSDSHCSQCLHSRTEGYCNSMPRRRHRVHIETSGDNSASIDYEEICKTYTSPAHRVSKSPLCAREQSVLVKNPEQYCKGLSSGHSDRDSFSEVFGNAHVSRRRIPSHQYLRRNQVDALDSGEEFSNPACSSTLPPRPRCLKLNHLVKSAGTGLDDLMIAELTRSVTSLRSDVERLMAQQLPLRNDPNDLNTTRPVVGIGSANSSLNQSIASFGDTRAMWNTGASLRHSSQCHVQKNGNTHKMDDSPDQLAYGDDAPMHNFSSAVEIEQPEFPFTLESKSMEAPNETTTKSSSPEFEVTKPAEKLFIPFENSTSQCLQRTRGRLAAHKAADRSIAPESDLRNGKADEETQLQINVPKLTENAPIGLDDCFIPTDMKSDNSGFPMCTTNDDRMTGGDEDSGDTSAACSRTIIPRQSDYKQQRTFVGGIRGGDSSHTARSDSLSRRSIKSISRSRPTTSATNRRAAASVGPHGSLSRLSSGPSLSSLHRLENRDDSFYSCLGGTQLQTRLYVKPKSKSNRQVIVNAVSHHCLAGAVNESAKKLVLQALAAVDGSHFIILFRDNRCQYRALYAFDFDTEELEAICGNGPRKITHDMCDKFFKYNSGAKQFGEIPSAKHLSAVVDAITIQNVWWLRPPPLHSGAARSSASKS